MRSGGLLALEVVPASPWLDGLLLAELAGELGDAGLDRLLAIYESDLVKRLGLLAMHLSSGDGAATRRVLHAMAGASASAGAAGLAALCRSCMVLATIGAETLGEIETAALGTLAALGARRRAVFGAAL